MIEGRHDLFVVNGVYMGWLDWFWEFSFSLGGVEEFWGIPWAHILLVFSLFFGFESGDSW